MELCPYKSRLSGICPELTCIQAKEPLISLLRSSSVEKWIHCGSIMRLLVWASQHGVCGLVYIDLNCQSEYPELSEEHVLTIQHSYTIILFWLTEIWINCFIETAKTSSVFLKLNFAVTPQARFSKNRAVCSFFLSFNLRFHFFNGIVQNHQSRCCHMLSLKRHEVRWVGSLYAHVCVEQVCGCLFFHGDRIVILNML